MAEEQAEKVDETPKLEEPAKEEDEMPDKSEEKVEVKEDLDEVELLGCRTQGCTAIIVMLEYS